MRRRTFRRVLLSELVEPTGDGWEPVQRADGTRGYTTFSEGRAATLAELREDYAAELTRSMERRGR